MKLLQELLEAKEKSILSVMGKLEDPFPYSFHCETDKLTSLVGAPSVINGNFYCHSNQLTSLEGAPSVIKGDFWCHANKLTSLVGAPSVIKGDFYCHNNKLTSLSKESTKSLRRSMGLLSLVIIQISSPMS